MSAEGQRLLAKLKPNDQVWALDKAGRAWSSEEWAKGLDRAKLSGSARLVLIIGGAEGLAPEVLKRAQVRLSLGSPTLAHELAALVTLEQLYRAHTILAGNALS
jgi:23S rRNA (pseudouridine1915-N3)-methyltransferase